MKKAALLISLCILSYTLRSQSLSPSVISSSGGFYSSSTVTLSQTVGEMTMVETFNGGSNILTQGFQQPNDILFVGFDQPVKRSIASFQVYPNPSSDHITVVAKFDQPGKILIQMFDHLGQLVSSSEQENAVNGMFQSIIQLEDFAPGIYSIRLSYSSLMMRKVYVEKVSVIK